MLSVPAVWPYHLGEPERDVFGFGSWRLLHAAGSAGLEIIVSQRGSVGGQSAVERLCVPTGGVDRARLDRTDSTGRASTGRLRQAVYVSTACLDGWWDEWSVLTAL